MPSYTDEDVQRLVRACTDLGRITHNRSIWIPEDRLDYIRQALAPFQRDPDAEVIEAMAMAIASNDRRTGHHCQVDRNRARAALAAYRKATDHA